MSEWARWRLQETREAQRRRYDGQVQPQAFAPGDWVLLLLPTSDTKLFARWQGPYEVTRQMGPEDYKIQPPSGNTDISYEFVEGVESARLPPG